MRNQLLLRRLDYYQSIYSIRLMMNLFYVASQVFLPIYLLFIPIQIAYFWLIASIDDGRVQTIIDLTVLLFFSLHIILFIDEQMLEWSKKPYSPWYHRFKSFQFFYDIACVGLCIYSVVLVDVWQRQQALQFIFVGKIYKVIKFDNKCTNIVIGTIFQSFYKILRTLLILFMVISYVGSLFYGLAYYLYIHDVQYNFLLWILDSFAVTNLINKQFIIQLQYSMYWALGTASTAAYGDISAAQPSLVLVNILALAFQGFLFGFYLNSMHSIPNQNKQKEANLLQKFQAFQQHSSNKKISKKLYLQILCSLQYAQSQQRKIDQVQKFLPKKYLQQIKSSIYRQMLDNQIFFHNQEFKLKISSRIMEAVSQIGEDVYNYRNIRKNDLLYLKEGVINYYINGEIKQITLQVVQPNQFIGIFQFITGLLIPQRAICINYCKLYRVDRAQFRKLLPEKLKLEFNQLQQAAFRFQGKQLDNEPIIKFINNVRQKQIVLALLNQEQKQRIIKHKYRESYMNRHVMIRHHWKNKIYIPKQKIKIRNSEVQTQQTYNFEFQQIQNWNSKYPMIL